MANQNLERALRDPKKPYWIEGLDEQEIEEVTMTAGFLELKIGYVRRLIENEDWTKAGCEFEKLLQFLPDEYRRDALQLKYLERSDVEESENPI